MDGNDAKQEIARSQKNPAQDVNEDDEVCFCKWMDRLSRVWTQVPRQEATTSWEMFPVWWDEQMQSVL